MAKSSGLGMACLVAGYNLSGDIGVIDNVHGGNSPLDVTGIDMSANERIGGLRDGGMEFTAFFNPAANQEHARFKLLPTTDQIVSVAHRLTVGNAVASCVGKQINYDPTRGADGSLTEKINIEANGFGIEWGTVLAWAVQGSAGATPSHDFTASSAFGLQAYLQLVSFTGTSITVAIQESSDNGAGDPFANVTGGVFTAATAVGAQRIATSNSLTVERYLRVNTTGTFSAALFLVQVTRNPIAGQVF